MTTFPEISDVPELDTATMVEVDILMMEDFGISLVQMMENAGRGLAILTRELALEGGAHGKSVTTGKLGRRNQCVPDPPSGEDVSGSAFAARHSKQT
jgi:hypothetical protein